MVLSSKMDGCGDTGYTHTQQERGKFPHCAVLYGCHLASQSLPCGSLVDAIGATKSGWDNLSQPESLSPLFVLPLSSIMFRFG